MALSPDLGVAGNVLVFMVCTMNWYNGLIVPYDQIQVFWRYWVGTFLCNSWESNVNASNSSTTSTPSPIFLAVS